MTDEELVLKKLARIESAVADLRRSARPERIRDDVREERFVEHTLQIAIQALLDVGSHIASDERLGEPATNRDLVDLLVKHGWLKPDLRDSLAAMVGFRNVLVHEYDEVDLDIVEDVVRNRLDDLLAFVASIRTRLRPQR